MTAKLFTMSFDSQPYTFTGEGWFNATQAKSQFGWIFYDYLKSCNPPKSTLIIVSA